MLHGLTGNRSIPPNRERWTPDSVSRQLRTVSQPSARYAVGVSVRSSLITSLSARTVCHEAKACWTTFMLPRDADGKGGTRWAEIKEQPSQLATADP
jgi:hypothetical protein